MNIHVHVRDLHGDISVTVVQHHIAHHHLDLLYGLTLTHKGHQCKSEIFTGMEMWVFCVTWTDIHVHVLQLDTYHSYMYMMYMQVYMYYFISWLLSLSAPPPLSSLWMIHIVRIATDCSHRATSILLILVEVSVKVACRSTTATDCSYRATTELPPCYLFWWK